MIIMVRADDRLIHGMVAVSWTSHLQPQTILVPTMWLRKIPLKP